MCEMDEHLEHCDPIAAIMVPFLAMLEPKLAVRNPQKNSTKCTPGCCASKVQIVVAAQHLKNVAWTLGNGLGGIPHRFRTKISGFWHTSHFGPKWVKMPQNGLKWMQKLVTDWN